MEDTTMLAARQSQAHEDAMVVREFIIRFTTCAVQTA